MLPHVTIWILYYLGWIGYGDREGLHDQTHSLSQIQDFYCTPTRAWANGHTADQNPGDRVFVGETVSLGVSHELITHVWKTEVRGVYFGRGLGPVEIKKAFKTLFPSEPIPNVVRLFANKSVALAWSRDGDAKSSIVLCKLLGRNVIRVKLKERIGEVQVGKNWIALKCGGQVTRISLRSGSVERSPVSAEFMVQDDSGNIYLGNSIYTKDYRGPTYLRPFDGHSIGTIKKPGVFDVAAIRGKSDFIGILEERRHVGNPFIEEKNGVRKVLGDHVDEILSANLQFAWKRVW